jgi:hypothetical protein
MVTMVDPEGSDPGFAGLVFAAHNNHDPRPACLAACTTLAEHPAG